MHNQAVGPMQRMPGKVKNTRRRLKQMVSQVTLDQKVRNCLRKQLPHHKVVKVARMYIQPNLNWKLRRRNGWTTMCEETNMGASADCGEVRQMNSFKRVQGETFKTKVWYGKVLRAGIKSNTSQLTNKCRRTDRIKTLIIPLYLSFTENYLSFTGT